MMELMGENEVPPPAPQRRPIAMALRPWVDGWTVSEGRRERCGVADLTDENAAKG
jgi:hypothetical protein